MVVNAYLGIIAVLMLKQSIILRYMAEYSEKD
jgi:hypothetical protein